MQCKKALPYKLLFFSISHVSEQYCRMRCRNHDSRYADQSVPDEQYALPRGDAACHDDSFRRCRPDFSDWFSILYERAERKKVIQP